MDGHRFEFYALDPRMGSNSRMMKNLHYGATAKILHWLVVVLLAIQFPIGWLMPDIHRGVSLGAAMTWHISIGTVILALIIGRFVWRLMHPVAPESSLQPYQRITSEAVHWLLYLLAVATPLSGWFLASARGWTIWWFFLAPLPMLTAQSSPFGQAVGRWHANLELALLILIGFHVATAFLHVFYFRDGVMQRMLP
jgi:cytochrome b561